ncbi:MAG TPA: hypothetical protein VEZ16_12745 [Microvirga sp.]|nr:hypothetical protein [Microvirga sp.]
MNLSVKSLMAAAVAFGGLATFQPEPASAQPYVYRTGVPAGLQRPVNLGARAGFRPAVAPGYYGARWGGGPRWGYGPRWGGGYRSAYWGPRYGYYGYPYRYRRGWDGGAVAAGLIGGLALGAIASAATNPYYYSPAYYAPTQTCFIERRRIVNRYGRVVVRRVQTCY